MSRPTLIKKNYNCCQTHHIFNFYDKFYKVSDSIKGY